MNVMIIPAAGRGSRLNFDGPKLLYPLAEKTMLAHLIQRYETYIDLFVLVINPDAQESVRQELELSIDETQSRYQLFFQAEATGMLDAITIPMDDLHQHRDEINHVWISWCDQVSITESTAKNLNSNLIQLSKQFDEYLALPTVTAPDPYIHLQRDNQNAICQILQRRENDDMPDVGENDCGLFAMNGKTYFDALKQFSSIDQQTGLETKERNFLPFIAWLAQTSSHHKVDVKTFPASSQTETIGVNTIEDAKKLLSAWNELAEKKLK